VAIGSGLSPAARISATTGSEAPDGPAAVDGYAVDDDTGRRAPEQQGTFPAETAARAGDDRDPVGRSGGSR